MRGAADLGNADACAIRQTASAGSAARRAVALKCSALLCAAGLVGDDACVVGQATCAGIARTCAADERAAQIITAVLRDVDTCAARQTTRADRSAGRGRALECTILRRTAGLIDDKACVVRQTARTGIDRTDSADERAALFIAADFRHGNAHAAAETTRAGRAADCAVALKCSALQRAACLIDSDAGSTGQTARAAICRTRAADETSTLRDAADLRNADARSIGKAACAGGSAGCARALKSTILRGAACLIGDDAGSIWKAARAGICRACAADESAALRRAADLCDVRACAVEEAALADGAAHAAVALERAALQCTTCLVGNDARSVRQTTCADVR